MNTQPDNLPFIKDPLFDHILNEADRQKFAPKSETDEWWSEDKKAWELYGNGSNSGRFYNTHFYRRRKRSGWVSVKERLPEAGREVLLDSPDCRFLVTLIDPKRLSFHFPSATHWMEIPVSPQPPKPAAEVAFESLWPELQKQVGLTKGSTYSLFKEGWDAAKANKGEL